MKLVKNLVLVISAICVVKVLAATVLMLLSIPPVFFALSVDEAELRITYEILMVYFLVIAILLLIISASLFNQATNRKAFQINLALIAIAFAVCGAHFAVAVVGDSESLLVQAALSSIWVPIFVCSTALASFLIARLAHKS